MLRKCPKCLLELTEDAYPPSAWKKGPGNQCRSCSSIQRKSIRKENIEKYRLKDKERYKHYKHTSVRAFAYKKSYGLSIEDVESMYRRQSGLCYGCFLPFPLTGQRGKTLCVDHNHTTKQIRGLLCNNCNRSLGLLKESPETLRRLVAFLDRDPKKCLVYIAGSLKNTRIPEIGNLLRSHNYDAMDEWYTPGPQADENWQEYEKLRGRTFAEALKGRAATNIFLFDKSYLDLCDAFVSVLPSGKSAALEMGYVKGKGKPACFFTDGIEPERYDIMPNFADQVLTSEDELLLWLESVTPKL